MKKILKYIIVMVLGGFVTLMVFGIINRNHKNKITNDRIKTLPIFSMKTVNDSLFHSDEIKSGPVLIIFFHPECEHCQFQIKSIFSKWNNDLKTKVILISNAEKNTIREFLAVNSLLVRKGIIVLVDESYRFYEFFGTDVVPSIFIYDENLRIKWHYLGEVKPETILKYLRQNG